MCLLSPGKCTNTNQLSAGFLVCYVCMISIFFSEPLLHALLQQPLFRVFETNNSQLLHILPIALSLHTHTPTHVPLPPPPNTHTHTHTHIQCCEATYTQYGIFSLSLSLSHHEYFTYFLKLNLPPDLAPNQGQKPHSQSVLYSEAPL